MYQLSHEQVNLIRKEVERQDIHFRHLAHDLVDHLCCEIEEMLLRGMPFQQALHEVRQLIGTDGLQELQKDTLYLTDHKYRFMKNTVKFAGVAGMALLAFGIFFKLQHWMGGNILLVLGFLLVGGLYFPLSMVVMRKEYQQLDRPLIYFTAMIGGLAIIFAVLLKVVHWPGANILFLTGYSSLGLLFVPLLVYNLLKTTSDAALKQIYIVGAVFFFFCLAGGLFKLLHYPGAMVMLVIGSLGFTAVFFPMYVLKTFKVDIKVEPGFILLCIGIIFFNFFKLLMALN